MAPAACYDKVEGGSQFQIWFQLGMEPEREMYFINAISVNSKWNKRELPEQLLLEVASSLIIKLVG